MAYTPILFLRDMSTLCVVDHLGLLVLRSLLGSLVPWHQQCVTVHHVPKWMSYHKAIGVITGRAHCFPSSVLIHLRVFNLTCLKQRFDDFLFQVSFYMYNLQSILSMFLHGTIYNIR